MPGMFKKEGLALWDILRKFYNKQRRISTLPQHVVWRLLHLDPNYGFFIQERESFTGDIVSCIKEEHLQTCWGSPHLHSSEFCVGRDGYHLMILFECDTCVVRKLEQRSPQYDFPPDKKFLEVIRRDNLDAFRSRASSTVQGNRDKVTTSLELLANVGLKGTYKSVGAFPRHDHWYEVAITMLLASQ
jgi:hypothetical protein